MEAKGISIEKYPEIHGFGLGSDKTGEKYSGEKTFEALSTFVANLLKKPKTETEEVKGEL